MSLEPGRPSRQRQHVIDTERGQRDVIVARRHVVETPQNICRRKSGLRLQVELDTVAVGQPGNDLPQQCIFLSRDAHAGSRRVADDEQAQPRPLARFALPCTRGFRQRRNTQVGPDTLRHDDRGQGNCPQQVGHT